MSTGDRLRLYRRPGRTESVSEFDRGYACAISCIVAGHGESTETREALAACGLVSRKIAKERGVDHYDLKILHETLKELEDDGKAWNK